MSLDRDDWRALSRILSGYMEMALKADWASEKELTGMLAAFLRDHDMPQPFLESPACRGLFPKNPVTVLIDQSSGEVVTGRLKWVGIMPENWRDPGVNAADFVLEFDRDGHQVVGGCE